MSPAVLACMALAFVGLVVMVATALRAAHTVPDFDDFLGDLNLADLEEADLDMEEHARRLAEPFLTRVVGGARRAASARLERFVPAHYLAKLDRQLAHAGLGGKRSAGEQLAMQLGLVVVGAALMPLVSATTGLGPTAALLLPAMGFMLPSARLKRTIQARSDAAFKDLPDIVDMLAIAVEAGSGFEAAISIVCKNFESPLTDELLVALQEMELGLSRREALQQLRDRIDLDAVRTLVLALLQADALGIPVGRVLKGQAMEVRNRRRAWAREKAAKLPVKIMFPLVLFIFPPIMALVLAPAAMSFGKLG